MLQVTNLIGFGAGGDSAPAVTFVGSATSSGTTINLTSLAGAGRYCIIFAVAQNSTTAIPAAVTPSGFTNQQNNGADLGGTGVRLVVSDKVMVGGETTVSVTTGTSGHRSIALVFESTAAITGRTFVGSNIELNANDPASQTVTVAAAVTPVVVFGQMFGSGGSFTRTTTPTMVEVANGAGNQYAHYLIYSAAPQNQTTYDMPDQGANAISSGYVTLTF